LATAPGTTKLPDRESPPQVVLQRRLEATQAAPVSGETLRLPRMRHHVPHQRLPRGGLPG